MRRATQIDKAASRNPVKAIRLICACIAIMKDDAKSRLNNILLNILNDILRYS